MTTSVPVFSDVDFRALVGDPSKTGNDAGFGSLTTAKGALPLAALDVKARLDGLVATMEVRQTFVNTHAEPLEATYIFPLPDRAAVGSFHLEVAGRIIEGELQERGKARQEYAQAIQAGHRAAIAEEERPGVFTLCVGNLPPGERAVVRLTLIGPLPYSDGEATFRFPLVVAPRYIPGTPLAGPPVGTGVQSDTDIVPDASRIGPPVLLPGFPNPVRLSLSVEVPASTLDPHDFRSSLHTVVEEQTDLVRRFRVLPGERLDRDFIFRYRLGADRVHTSLTVCPDATGAEGAFLLTVMPPIGKEAKRPRPRDVVFVLDRSGSMSGWKMVAARRAVTRMVETLTEHDRFSVYAFDDRIDTPAGFDGTALVPASDHQRFRAAEFLAGIDARGGTEMEAPLDRAMQELLRGSQRSDGDRILVLITDGQVGNEDGILRKLAGRGPGVRIFTLGIDRAVNAAFLRRLADLGGGSSEVVESEERLDAVMDQVHRHIGTPVLTGLSLSPAGLDFVASSLTPGRFPDLFAGAPLLIAGRYRGPAQGAIRLSATDAAGETWSTEVRAWKEEAAPLAKVWARARVRELEDRYAIDHGDRAKLEHEILETSLRFGVLSRFTAFVAVDRSSAVNPGGKVKQITQPVEQPAGWGQNAASGTLAACAPPNAAGAVARGAFIGGARARKVLSSSPAGARKIDSVPALDALMRGQDKPLTIAEVEARLRQQEGQAKTSPPPATPPPTDEVESVDSMLCEFSDTADEETTLRSPGGADRGGLLQGLLGLFGLGKQQAKDDAAPDREPFRGRVESLLARLQAQPADARARLELLRSLAVELETLFADLVAAGDRHEAAERLGKTLATLRPMLLEASPQACAIEQHHVHLAAALRAWLALLPPPVGTDPAARREGFWK